MAWSGSGLSSDIARRCTCEVKRRDANAHIYARVRLCAHARIIEFTLFTFILKFNAVQTTQLKLEAFDPHASSIHTSKFNAMHADQVHA